MQLSRSQPAIVVCEAIYIVVVSGWPATKVIRKDSKGKIRGIDFFGVLEDITEALRIPVDLIEASQIVAGGRAQREKAETGVVIYERI